MSERVAGKILAFHPGMELTPRREVFDAASVWAQEREIPRELTTLSDIENRVYDSTQAMLPEELIEQLGFASLSWQLLKKHNSLAAIFLGASNPVGPIRVDEAMGVIEVNSYKRPFTRSFDSAGMVQPGSVQVSGVAIDSEGGIRTVGYYFDERYDYSLRSAHISVSDAELPRVEYTDLLHDVTDDYNRCSRDIPSHVFRGSYETAALITKAQAELSGHTRAFKVDHHYRHGSRIELGNYDDYPNPGFSVNDTESGIILSYDPSHRGQGRVISMLSADFPTIPWSIQIPRQLVK